jgi:predicted transcriptional regulator
LIAVTDSGPITKYDIAKGTGIAYPVVHNSIQKFVVCGCVKKRPARMGKKYKKAFLYVATELGIRVVLLSDQLVKQSRVMRI